MHNEIPRRWLTLAEAADHLGVTERTIRNYIARGALPGYRLAGKRALRVKLTDVNALLAPVPVGAHGAA